MTFSKKLFELRKQKGLSQEELANKINVSRQTLSKWELGESTPDMEKLILLSDYFQVSLDELVLDKKMDMQKNCTEHTIVRDLNEIVFTEKNNKRFKRGIKMAGIIFAIILAIDIISMIIYFIIYGLPR